MSSRTAAILADLADSTASILPEVDAHADHSRWKPGLGPFEEENQIEMLIEGLDTANLGYSLRSEVVYPDQGLKSDVVIDASDLSIPVEAKLLRFRYDNGNINPASFSKVFSPFPERSSSSLLTDAKKLSESNFEPSGGLLGLYYEEEDEPYHVMDANAIAEKFSLDVDYWYGFEVETTNVAHFEGLQHPHHERGAVISWRILD